MIMQSIWVRDLLDSDREREREREEERETDLLEADELTFSRVNEAGVYVDN